MAKTEATKHSITILAVFDQYVLVRMQHPITAELIRQCLAGAATLVDQAGVGQVSGLLIDLGDVPNLDSTGLDYWFVQADWGRYGVFTPYRIAVVVTSDDCPSDFIETISLKADFPVKFFQQERAAREWLKEGVPD